MLDWLTKRFRGTEAVAIREAAGADAALAEANQSAWELEQLTERLATLELALEDVGWLRMGLEAEQEFSREGLRKITELARLYQLKNPLVNRAVSVQAAYVWAQGVSLQARHPALNQVLQQFLDDEGNKAELGHQARMEKETELQTDGNLFPVFFVDQLSGRVRMRSVPFSEIEDVYRNPQDRKEPWFYKRVWVEDTLNPATGTVEPKRTVAWYPDWRYRPAPAQRLRTIGGDPVRWDSPMMHVKVGGYSDWRFGVSEVYAAIDWARAYKEFLEDWSKITKSLSKFVWNLSTTGGAKSVASAQKKFGTTLAAGGSAAETNPPAVAGSMFIAGAGEKLEPIKTAGSTTKAEDGRRLLLMVAAATGWPETFFGDVSVGTLATATSLDRPTELRIRNRQTLWADILKAFAGFVLFWAVKAPNGALRALGQIQRDADGRERVVWGDDPETGDPVDPALDVDFPPVIERDVDKAVGSIVRAATLDGKPLAGTLDEQTVTRLLLVALGEDDIDETLSRLFPEDGSMPAADVVEALRGVRELVHELKEARRGSDAA